MVCLTEFQIDDKYRQLDCNHSFHSNCIKIWLKKERSCPLCKQEVQVVGPNSPDEEAESFND